MVTDSEPKKDRSALWSLNWEEEEEEIKSLKQVNNNVSKFYSGQV